MRRLLTNRRQLSKYARNIMLKNKSSLIGDCISAIISRIIAVIYPTVFFLKKKCWRISLKKANELGYNQISNSTEENRYPEIFAYVQKLTGEYGNTLNILSFGCSLGTECFTLRKYFNDANITGYDIFKKNIEIANNNNNDKNIFFTTEWDHVNCQNHYDIVFAMTVLCRSPHTHNKKNCSNIYSFNQFEQQILLLDQIIKTNGLLVIYNANFLFADTEVSLGYKPIKIPNYSDSGIVPKFNKHNKLLDDQNYVFTVFEKKAVIKKQVTQGCQALNSYPSKEPKFFSIDVAEAMKEFMECPIGVKSHEK